MHYIIHADDYDTAILIKESALNKEAIEKHYLVDNDIQAISFSLDYGEAKKPSAATIHAYLEELLVVLRDSDIRTLLVCDGEYFKKLCKVQKSEPHYGSILPVAIKGYEHMQACLCTNYQALTYNPTLQKKIDLSLHALIQYQAGDYSTLGANIIHKASYPDNYTAIKEELDRLLEIPELTCDIEAFSLKHYEAGIGTISFAENKHEGVAFCVDYQKTEPEEIQVWCTKDKKYKTRTSYGRQVENAPVRALLKSFFENYKGKLLYHGASYDVYVLIYALWMDNLLDQEGLLFGLELMTANFEDTMIMTYLATNSCVGNKLGLKEQAHEFAGNYAEEDIKNIRLIPEPELLKYNLIDTLGTWYTYDKHKDTLVTDKQVEIYTLFKGFLVDIIQMQLTGACIDMPRVLEAEVELQAISDKHFNALRAHPAIIDFTETLRQERIIADNLKLKQKKRTYEEVAHICFNPNSGAQVQKLLYETLSLPVLDYTKKKAPSTKGKTLAKLIELPIDPSAKQILTDLLGYVGVNKILTSFIPALKLAPLAPDGYHYLFGSFQLGGTVSGRLSSANPNLQNLPSGSSYAKIIKSCFIAPKGWLLVGADSNALEDRINTLLTGDPNKEKVLLDGFDGHSFRTYHFWPHKFAHLNPEDPVSINLIEKEYKADRSLSKPVHFAMQYYGTFRTLMTNCGFAEPEARQIESNYHTLYRVSFDWIDQRILQASKDGYATAAFGLRIRCPVLEKSIVGKRTMSFEAGCESRTLGNALSGQSYGMLNSRSANEFMTLVRADPVKRLQVKPSLQIHDAQYYLIRDDLNLVQWVNTELPRCMAWQDLPELQHPKITLPANMDIYYPNWANEITLENNISIAEITHTIKESIK